MEKSGSPYKFTDRLKEELPNIRSVSTCSRSESKETNSFLKPPEIPSKYIRSQPRFDSKDPNVKKHRFDYNIFFRAKGCGKPSQPQKAIFITGSKKCSQRDPAVPIRYYSVEKIKQELKVNQNPQGCKIGLATDLLLLKSINKEEVNKQLELDKFYNEKFGGFHVPPVPEVLIDRFLHTHKTKHVKFCL